MPDKVLYTAEATSTGDGRNGHVATSDGRIDLDLAFPPELGGTGAGSNPEQLFAAAYAACFHSALRRVAGREHGALSDSTVTAQVGIGPDGDSFGLVVTLVIHIPGMEREKVREFAEAAHQVCPYSRATRGNVSVELRVLLSMPDIDLEAIKAERARLEAAYITPDRPATSARGIHHAALICSDVEQTIKFYQGILEFPLTELFGNRDYKGSTHFFFDVGNGNLLAFFDFPGLDLEPYRETLGNINHIAISVTKEKWDYLRGKLDAAGVDYQVVSGTSIYFKGPDGVRLELLADPLGEMYGTKVL
jgi:Ohr subfamily peroxiredoxin